MWYFVSMIVLTYCENNLLNIKLKITIELTNNKLDFITIEYIIRTSRRIPLHNGCPLGNSWPWCIMTPFRLPIAQIKINHFVLVRLDSRRLHIYQIFDHYGSDCTQESNPEM